ncbi:MAG TPA: AAA family ATPase [Moorella mulderi]|nr:AAA family ATPase [Moorella mulderi]
MEKIRLPDFRNIKIIPPSEEEGAYRCPLCEDRGIILKEGKAYRCRCALQRAWQNRLRAANLAPHLRRCTFAAFNLEYYSKNLKDELTGRSYYECARLCLEEAQRFVDNCKEGKRGRGLFIFGPVGSGKTFLAAAITNSLIEAGHQVLFAVVPDLLDAIKATYDRPGEGQTELEILDTARQVPVLVLDDLGAHAYSEWTQQKIYSLLNYRLLHELPTVVTSNLELRELEAYLGERTVSRLIELCKSLHLPVERDIRCILNRQQRD